MARLSVEAGKAVCEALGLSAALVTSIDIHLRVNQPAMVEVVQFVGEHTPLTNVLRRFELVEREAIDGE